jgi:cell division protein FtsW (lipid II flippase)
MKEFQSIILGNASVAEFLAAMFFALLTAGGLALVRVKKRDVSSPRTPEEFSWKFFWNDNFRQIIGTFILIFLTIRIAQYWIKPEWAVYGAVIIGLISDQLAMLALKLKDKATSFLSKKIDRVGEKVDGVEDKVDALKEDIKDIKDNQDK